MPEGEEEEESFFAQPLGFWIRDCVSGSSSVVSERVWRRPSRLSLPIAYFELCDGRAFAHLLALFEPFSPGDAVYVDVSTCAEEEDAERAIHRLFFVLHQLKRFYRFRLQRFVVVSTLPDVVSIHNRPTPDGSGVEMTRLLHLLLGAAVQSESRRSFVERITLMEQPIQVQLAASIQQITDESSGVVPLAEDEDCSDSGKCEEGMGERTPSLPSGATSSDEAASLLHEQTESDSAGSSNGHAEELIGRKGERRPPSPLDSFFSERHSQVEVAKQKMENRKLRDLLYEKEEMIEVLRDEVKNKEKEALRYNDKYLSVFAESQKVRPLQDEVDSLLQKVERYEKFERENGTLREKLEDFEFFRDRAKDLERENEALEEKLQSLEEKMEMNRVRAKGQAEAEGRLAEADNNIQLLHADIAFKNTELERLMMECGRLERELLEQSNLSGANENSLLSPNQRHETSLLDEMEEINRSEVQQLRAENLKLKKRLDGIKSSEELEELKELRMCLEKTEERAEKAKKELTESRQQLAFTEQQMQQLEATLSALSQQAKTAKQWAEQLKTERDAASKSLLEARRNFAQFQAEFGKKINEDNRQKMREVERACNEMERQLTVVKEEKAEQERLLLKVREENGVIRGEKEKILDEKSHSDSAAECAMRAKESMETERNALRAKLSNYEDEVEELRVRLIESGDWKRRAEASEKLLADKLASSAEIEAEHRQMAHQMELEQKKTQRLREDLVSEKTRLSDLVGRLRSLCTLVTVNGGKMETELSDCELVDRIDSVLMESLAAARREADSLRIQQHQQIQELTDLKRDIQKLRRSESANLSESDDRVRSLLEESGRLKQQLAVLKEKDRQQQIDSVAKEAQISSARKQVEELMRDSVKIQQVNSEVARLQVSHRNLQLQEELMRQDNNELRKQLDVAEKAKQEAKRKIELMEAEREGLQADHDRLKQLHDLLSHDYECLKAENAEIKNRVRILRGEADSLRADNDCLSRECEQLTVEVRRLRHAEQNYKLNINNLKASIDNLTKAVHTRDLQILELKRELEILRELHAGCRQQEAMLREECEQRKVFQDKMSELHRQQYRLESDIRDNYTAIDKGGQISKPKQATFVKRNIKALLSKKPRAERPAATGNGSAGSTTEDSSTYSADELSPVPGSSASASFSRRQGMSAYSEMELQPTCSSSEEAERHSPPHLPMNGLRQRNGVAGGSLRLPASCLSPPASSFSNRSHPVTILEHSIPVNVSVSSALPPRAPLRGSAVTSSLRGRPPPPPYPSRAKTRPPPPYPGSNCGWHDLEECLKGNSRIDESCELAEFFPLCTSSPNAETDCEERRPFVRDMAERAEKAMSIYENVNNQSSIYAPPTSTDSAPSDGKEGESTVCDCSESDEVF